MRLSLLLLGVVSAVNALPSFDHRHVVHERRDTIPSTWKHGRRLHGEASLPMRIGLVQSNLDNAHDLLMEVSDHKSARYGKYYTAEEVHDLFAPAQDHVDAVREWLESAGIGSYRVTQSTNKQWLQFDAAVEEVENLLKTEYHIYSHSVTGKSLVACREYSVPEFVRNHIDYITPGIKFVEVGAVQRAKLHHSGLKKKRSASSKPPSLKDFLPSSNSSNCRLHSTTACIKELYGIPQNNIRAIPGNELGIFQAEDDIYSQEDLDLFFSNFAHDIPNGTHPVLNSIDGGIAPETVKWAGTESAMDFQLSYPIIWPQNSVLYQVSDFNNTRNLSSFDMFNDFLHAIDGSYCTPTDSTPDSQCGIYKPTNVISFSYGIGTEEEYPASYLRRQCNEYLKLGLRGVSVVVASGDNGVEFHGSCLGEKNETFVSLFPSSCPYLTTVGGTSLAPQDSTTSCRSSSSCPVSDIPETAVTSFPSSGGFSDIFPRPRYQQDAVERYFNISNPPYPYYPHTVNNVSARANQPGRYNRMGRGYPDVACIGNNFGVFARGQFYGQIGGTSTSAPVFAAILTRINAERLAKNKSTVGFVNPVLYAHPEVLRDVTVGSNSGCGTDGFKTAPGWDPVTGLGSPNYPKLLDLFMKID